MNTNVLFGANLGVYPRLGNKVQIYFDNPGEAEIFRQTLTHHPDLGAVSDSVQIGSYQPSASKKIENQPFVELSTPYEQTLEIADKVQRLLNFKG